MILSEELLHLGQFAFGALQRGRPDLVQQLVDGVGRPGHLVGHHIVGIRRIAQQMGLFRAQADEVVDQLFVVVLVAVVAAVEIRLVNLLAQFAFLGVGQKRDQAGFVQREDILALLARRFGLLAGLIADVGGNAVQVGRFEHQRIVAVLSEDVLPELHRSQRQFAVDGFQTGFLLGVEQRPGAHEIAVGLLQQTVLLGIELQCAAPVVDGLHPFEELFVQQNLVGVRRQQGHHPLLQSLHLGGVLRGAEHAEDQLRLRKHPPRAVVGEDDVLERRGVVIRRDGVDLGVVQRHAALQSGQEVFGSYPVEGRHPVGRIPFGEKGIFARMLVGFAGHECHGQNKCQ